MPTQLIQSRIRRGITCGCCILLCFLGCGRSPEKTVVLLGDSITEQAFLGCGYVKELSRKFPNIRFVNAGRSGSKAEDLLLCLDSGVLAKIPSAVVVMVGVNDVWHRLKTGFTQAHLKAFRENLRRIVERLANEVPVFLCTTTIIEESFGSQGNQELKRVNDAIRELGAISNVTIVDIHRTFRAACSDPGHRRLTSDGVHLTREGNALVAGELEKALHSWLNASARDT